MEPTEPLLLTSMGWLGQTWGYWIQTVAFLMSGVAALGAIIFSAVQIRLIRTQLIATKESNEQQQQLLIAQLEAQERQSQHRATVEVVRHEQTDKELLEAFKGYASLREKDGFLTTIAATHPEPLDDHSKVMRVLNNYEYVSVGILVGAFNEEIYKRMKRSALIRDWDALCPYVYHLRQKYSKPKLYVELEALATKWKQD